MLDCRWRRSAPSQRRKQVLRAGDNRVRLRGGEFAAGDESLKLFDERLNLVGVAVVALEVQLHVERVLVAAVERQGVDVAGNAASVAGNASFVSGNRRRVAGDSAGVAHDDRSVAGDAGGVAAKLRRHVRAVRRT